MEAENQESEDDDDDSKPIFIASGSTLLFTSSDHQPPYHLRPSSIIAPNSIFSTLIFTISSDHSRLLAWANLHLLPFSLSSICIITAIKNSSYSQSPLLLIQKPPNLLLIFNPALEHSPTDLKSNLTQQQPWGLSWVEILMYFNITSPECMMLLRPWLTTLPLITTKTNVMGLSCRFFHYGISASMAFFNSEMFNFFRRFLAIEFGLWFTVTDPDLTRHPTISGIFWPTIATCTDLGQQFSCIVGENINTWSHVVVCCILCRSFTRATAQNQVVFVGTLRDKNSLTKLILNFATCQLLHVLPCDWFSMGFHNFNGFSVLLSMEGITLGMSDSTATYIRPAATVRRIRTLAELMDDSQASSSRVLCPEFEITSFHVRKGHSQAMEQQQRWKNFRTGVWNLWMLAIYVCSFSLCVLLCVFLLVVLISCIVGCALFVVGVILSLQVGEQNILLKFKLGSGEHQVTKCCGFFLEVMEEHGLQHWVCVQEFSPGHFYKWSVAIIFTSLATQQHWWWFFGTRLESWMFSCFRFFRTLLLALAKLGVFVLGCILC